MAKLQLIAAMVIFGTIGIFRRYIPMDSSVIAMSRGFIGTIILLLVISFQKKKFSLEPIRKNLVYLCVSGGFIGINWILLFESYRYTSVATATLCYYMAPIFVIIASPFLLKEKLSLPKALCVLVALTGMVCVSGVLTTEFSGVGELKGVLFGLGAAVFYAMVILLNKKIHDISAYDKTVMQLGAATVVILPYVLLTVRNVFTEDRIALNISTPVIIAMLIVVGIVHTGVAYTLYFGSMKDLKAQTVALFSYIDPIVAIILSAVILQEKPDLLTAIGAVMVLGSTIVSDMIDSKSE